MRQTAGLELAHVAEQGPGRPQRRGVLRFDTQSVEGDESERPHQILAGELEFRLGKRKVVAKPGDRILVPAGTPHRFENGGEETAHFVCEVRPALGFEQLIETMFSLAEDGKVNGKGMPNPFAITFALK